MSLQDLIDTINENPSQVREALELIKRQLPAYPEATEAADADFIPLTKAGGGTEKLPLPILDQRSVTPLPNITSLSSLNTATLVDGQQFRRKEFWPGTGVGGVDLYWDASRPVSEHNGGTIIDPAKISELNTTAKTFGAYFNPDTVSGNTGCFVVGPIDVLDPAIFGSLLEGDQSEPWQATLASAPEGATIRSCSPASITLSELEFIPRNLHLDFRGCSVKAVGLYLLRSEGSWSDMVEVSSLTASSMQVPEGSFSVGDVLKVTCTDEQPDFWLDRRYLGQFVIVHSVQGTEVTFDRELYYPDLYQTNVRAAALEKTSLKISNLSVVGDRNDQRGLIRLGSIYRPVVESCDFQTCRYAAINLESCYGYEVSNIDVNDCRTVEIPSGAGYTVTDESSSNGTIRNLTAARCRHAFTNNAFRASDDGQPDPKCGYSTNIRVINSDAYQHYLQAWDTHPGIIGITFDGCRAHGPGGVGQSRSRKTTWRNCYGNGVEEGFAFGPGASGTTIQPNTECQIIGGEYTLTGDRFIRIYGTPGASDPAECSVQDVKCRIGDANSRCYFADLRDWNFMLEVSNLRLIVASQNTDAVCATNDSAFSRINFENSYLTLGDYNDASDNFYVVFAPSAASQSSVRVFGVSVETEGFGTVTIYPARGQRAFVDGFKIRGDIAGLTVPNNDAANWSLYNAPD